MGCGASNAADGNDAAPKRWRERNGEARAKRHEVRGGSDSLSTLDTSTLSTGLLDDLRQKQRMETASLNPVKRWIESIAAPTDQDNPDLFDPVRRHRLSMESVVQKQRRSVSAAATSTSRDTSEGVTSRPSGTEQQNTDVSEGAGPTEQAEHHSDDTHNTSTVEGVHEHHSNDAEGAPGADND
jgi:hypothetical protein